ncbi:hypothetical protein SLE2022_350740 [Rubroshorea leprosula]
MSLDVKGIRVLLWRIIRFFTNSFYKCVLKHPVVSGVLFVFFLLYLFLPSVFFILVLTSPVLVSVAFFIRVRLNSKRQNAAKVEKEDSEKSSVDSNNDGVKKSANPSFRSQKSVRRNVRKENIECDAQGNIITLTNPLDEILGRNSLFKEKHTQVREGEGSSALENGEAASNIANENNQADEDRSLLFDSEESKSNPIWRDGLDKQSEKVSGGDEAEVESMEDAEDEDEEEVQEDGNKAVEWTEDDQKNLMDLGFSELERNNRLESLIARRRARNLFRMAVEKSLVDMDSAHPDQIAPIFVARSRPFDDKKNPDQGGLHMPSSAPSILFPGRSPFDLPYDPYEEKPNLTGDSFQQEFMASHQKDIFFCRHESFCRGPFFPFEPKHDLQDPQLDLCFSTEENIVQSPRNSTFGRQLDKGGHEHHMSSSMGSATDLVQLESLDPTQVMNSEELPHEEHNMNENSFIEIEGEKTEDSNGFEPSLANELEVQTETDSIKDNKSSSSSSSDASEMILNKKKFPQVLSDHVQRTLVQVVPPKDLSLDRLPFDPSPTANDKSRLDNCSFFEVSFHTPTYSVASDLQVEVSEGGSPRLMALTDGAASFCDEDTVTYDADVDKDITPNSEEKLGEEKGSISRELHKTNAEPTFDGLTDWNKKLEDSIVLPTLLELEARQNVNGTVSLSSESRTTENSQSFPTDINHPNNEGVEPTLKEVEVSRMSNASNESSPRSLRNRIIEDFVVHSSSEVNFEKPKELPKPQEKFAVEARNSHDVEPIIHVNTNTVESKPTENSDGTHIFIEQEASRDLERPAEVVINSVSGEYNPINSEWSYDQGIMAYEKMMEDNRNLEFTGDREKDLEKLNQHNVGDIPEAVEGEDIMKLIQDSRDGKDVLENIIPTEEQRFNCPSSSLHPRLEIEQVSIATGSLSSPRTVLLQETPFIPNPQHSLENSIDHFPSNSNSRSLEGQYDMMVNSTEESDTMNQMNGPHFDLIEGKMDSLIKSTEGESKATFISYRDVEELLKLAEESNPSFSEHIERTYGNLTHEDSTSPSKSQGEEEAIRKFTEDNAATNINKFVVQEKEEKEKLTIPIVETQFSTRPEDMVQYDEPVEHEAVTNPSKVEGVKNDQKFAPAVDNINNIDESIANQMTNEDNMNHVVDNQGETQMSGRRGSVVQPSNDSEETNARYIGDSEYKSQSLFEEEGNASLLKPAGESSNSTVVENIEELRDLTSQESVKATQKLDENGLKAIESNEDKLHDLPEGDEPSKPTVAEAKAINTDKRWP